MINENETHDFLDGKGPVPAHRHPNGGGWVANTAHVADSAYVGKFAKVYDRAQITDYARITDKAQVLGNAWVSGSSKFGLAPNIEGFSKDLQNKTRYIDKRFMKKIAYDSGFYIRAADGLQFAVSDKYLARTLILGFEPNRWTREYDNSMLEVNSMSLTFDPNENRWIWDGDDLAYDTFYHNEVIVGEVFFVRPT